MNETLASRIRYIKIAFSDTGRQRRVEELAVATEQLERENATLKAELTDWNNAVKHVEAEHTDEIHCGCVPVLRKKNTELKAELTRLCGLVERAKEIMRLELQVSGSRMLRR